MITNSRAASVIMCKGATDCARVLLIFMCKGATDRLAYVVCYLRTMNGLTNQKKNMNSKISSHPMLSEFIRYMEE
jgi:hypothetical protein